MSEGVGRLTKLSSDALYGCGAAVLFIVAVTAASTSTEPLRLSGRVAAWAGLDASWSGPAATWIADRADVVGPIALLVGVMAVMAADDLRSRASSTALVCAAVAIQAKVPAGAVCLAVAVLLIALCREGLRAGRAVATDRAALTTASLLVAILAALGPLFWLFGRTSSSDDADRTPLPAPATGAVPSVG